ncbi:antitoxin [Deinococcus sp. MIMF12]|uniref:Antitoxin n=1 Tax=Deinococcus rhizophilus TaxID=3049544 RepID=A0ABT7JFJ5_9DEIO|nr:antitoxin [Deinococcus rhizophilus]MDL2342713.1 antitoxin [Deinococcus rhizophilus]
MKLSVSLPEPQVDFLDHYQQRHRLSSRSEVLQLALKLLQKRALEEDYRAAGEEWQSSEDAALWDRASGDGL